jgi:hypothetical protein
MESKGFPFEIDCKFAILALHSVRAEVQTGIVLQDDIRVFDSFPFDLEDHWREWLGAIQFKRLRDCNLFLLRSSTEGWQQGQFQVAGDRISEQLQQDLGSMFAMLRMLGSIEYEDAFRPPVRDLQRQNRSTSLVGASLGRSMKEICGRLLNWPRHTNGSKRKRPSGRRGALGADAIRLRLDSSGTTPVTASMHSSGHWKH